MNDICDFNNENHQIQDDHGKNLMDALKQLDLAIADHTAWLKKIHRTLISRQPHNNDNDLNIDAHRLCGFGKWLYTQGIKLLGDSPDVIDIEHIHLHMHLSVRGLLEKLNTQQSIPTVMYDEFIDQAIQFKSLVRRKQHNMIKTVCRHDQLTGAINRCEMVTRLGQQQSRVEIENTDTTIAMMNFDHFKTINDQYGHSKGDRILKQSIYLCNSLIGCEDAIYRCSGEIFLICFTDTDLSQAKTFIEKLLANIAGQQFVSDDGNKIVITASFGLSQLVEEKPIEQTMSEAYHALMNAKSMGRNQYQV